MSDAPNTERDARACLAKMIDRHESDVDQIKILRCNIKRLRDALKKCLLPIGQVANSLPVSKIGVPLFENAKEARLVAMLALDDDTT